MVIFWSSQIYTPSIFLSKKVMTPVYLGTPSSEENASPPYLMRITELILQCSIAFNILVVFKTLHIYKHIILTKCLLIFVTLIRFQSERLHIYQQHIDTLLQVRRNQFALQLHVDQGQEFEESLRIYSHKNSRKAINQNQKRFLQNINISFVNLWESTDSCQNLFGESKWILALSHEFLSLAFRSIFRCYDNIMKFSSRLANQISLL